MAIVKTATVIRPALLIAAAALTACTWIKLTEAGAGVEQATADQVADCRKVGDVSASTQDRVIVERGRGKVAEELIVLARNEAATLGGNAIVPKGPMVDGRQDFEAYRCDDAGSSRDR